MTIYKQYAIQQKAVGEAQIAIFLTGNLIKVAVQDFIGKSNQIREIYTCEVENGSLFDGRITDEDGFVEFLSEFFETRNLSHASVRLVVNSPEFVTRVLKVPKKKDSKIADYIKRYFGMAERLTSPVYGYLVLGEQTGGAQNEQSLLVSAVSSETVERYSRVFQKLGIKLLSVESALLTAVRVLSTLPEVKGKTCVVQMLNGRETVGMMFLNGVYQASVRSSLSEPFYTVGFGVEFARMNGQILQNMRKEYPSSKVECICLCGYQNENFTVCTEAVRHMGEDLPILSPDGSMYIYADYQTKDSPSCFSDYLIPVSALLFHRESEDFLAISRNARKKRMPSKYRAYLSVGLILAILLFSVSGFLYYRMANLTKERDALLSDVQALDERANRYLLVSAERNRYQTKIRAIRDLLNAIESYPCPNSALNDIILSGSTLTIDGEEIRIANITIESYDASRGLLQFKVTAPLKDVGNISTLIGQFCDLGVFSSVDYTGYVLDSGNNYVVNVVCYLDGSAGKEAQHETGN